jgi:hypothetical protein
MQGFSSTTVSSYETWTITRVVGRRQSLSKVYDKWVEMVDDGFDEVLLPDGRDISYIYMLVSVFVERGFSTLGVEAPACVTRGGRYLIFV